MLQFVLKTKSAKKRILDPCSIKDELNEDILYLNSLGKLPDPVYYKHFEFDTVQ